VVPYNVNRYYIRKNFVCVFCFFNSAVSTFFKWIHLLIHINNFFIVFFNSLPTKREIYYLQYNYVLIYAIYGDDDGTITAIIICDVRSRRIRHLFITFAVAIYYII
jgi:hypothetical protein